MLKTETLFFLGHQKSGKYTPSAGSSQTGGRSLLSQSYGAQNFIDHHFYNDPLSQNQYQRAMLTQQDPYHHHQGTPTAGASASGQWPSLSTQQQQMYNSQAPYHPSIGALVSQQAPPLPPGTQQQHRQFSQLYYGGNLSQNEFSKVGCKSHVS